MKACSIREEDYVESVGLPESEIIGILRELDQGETASAGHDRRSAPRHRCQDISAALIEIGPADGRIDQYRAVARNISCGGIAVLLGRAVDPGCSCTLMLQTIFGPWEVVSGRVARCRPVGESVYEVGVAFDAPIALPDFVLGIGALSD